MGELRRNASLLRGPTGRGVAAAASDRSPVSGQQTRRRMQAERDGRRSELLAAIWLVLKGYRILARRRRTPMGEIDIIAVRGRRLAFVEVKCRAKSGQLATAVSARQSRRLLAAAQNWLQHNPRFRDYSLGFDRCDVVERWRVSHHPDALQPPC